jgi:hypothetical protein
MTENVVLLCICCMMIIKSADYLFTTGRILKKGVLTEGKVIDIEKGSFLFLKIKWPVIEFTTINGKKIHRSCKYSWILKRICVEQKLTVIYDPSSPSRFLVDNGYSDIMNFTMLSVSASILLLTVYKMSVGA